MILNLTQHNATPEQRTAGVVDMQPEQQAILRRLLTFNTLPSWELVEYRAAQIAALAAAAVTDPAGPITSVMIGGAPFLMAPLERALDYVPVVYAFSQREVVEEMQQDGSVRKTAVFRHAGFVGERV